MNNFGKGSTKTLTNEEIGILINLRNIGDIDISDVHLLSESRKWEMYSYICYNLESEIGLVPKHYDDVSVRCDLIHGLVDKFSGTPLNSLKYHDTWKVFDVLKEDGYLEKQGNGYVLGIDPETLVLSLHETTRLNYIKAVMKNGGGN